MLKFDEKTKAYTYETGGRVQVEIGDSKQTDFLPRVKLSIWDNECNISFGIDVDKLSQAKGSKQATPTVEIEDDTVKWTDGNTTEAHFYPLDVFEGGEDGGFEFEVIWSEKPESNIINLTMNTPKDLKFYYQAPLTQEEIDEGCERPANVVGSYAVYHSSKQGDYSRMGGKNYKTGKAFHIYRPEAVDADGNKAWCELYIDPVEQIATITVPQEFLDVAVYPVVVDPTFGYTSAGGTSSYNFGGSIVGGRAISPDLSDKITFIRTFNSANSGTVSLSTAIYSSDASNNIQDRLAISNSNLSVGTTKQWQTLDIDYTFDPNTSYWLCAWASGYFTYYSDTGGSAKQYFSGGTGTFDNWPNPGGSGVTYSSRLLSIYAVYGEDLDHTIGSTTSGTSHTITPPANVEAGDLVILFFTSDGNRTLGVPTGWTILGEQASGTQAKFMVAYIIADGPMSSFAVTTSATEGTSWIVLRIPSDDISDGVPVISTAVTGTNKFPNPPSLASGFEEGAKTLWISAMGCDYNRSVDGFPSGFASNLIASRGIDFSTTSTAIATLQDTSASQDPDVFTINNSDEWVAYTLAVRFKSEEVPTLSEFEADVRRVIAIESSYPAETKRVVTGAQNYPADSRFQAIKAYGYPGDTIEQTVKAMAQLSDTFRPVIIDKEVVADTHRLVYSADISLSDSLRWTLKTYTSTGDAFSRAIKAYGYPSDIWRHVTIYNDAFADSLRGATKEQSTVADALRQGIRQYLYLGDTIKVTQSISLFGADTYKATHRIDTYPADTQRESILELSEIFHADTVRQIQAIQAHSADTLRRLALAQHFASDTLRRVLTGHDYASDALLKAIADYDFAGDTWLTTLMGYGYLSDTRRPVISGQSYFGDALLKSVKGYEHSADTVRYVVELGVYIGDTYHIIQASQVYDTDTLLKAIADYSYIADILRQVTELFAGVCITLTVTECGVGLSTVERMVSIDGQERLISMSEQERSVSLTEQERQVILEVIKCPR